MPREKREYLQRQSVVYWRGWSIMAPAELDNSRLGLIGFDGDLFVAGKRAENAGVRSLMSSRKQQVLNLTALSSLSLPELRARINQ